jgi:hypothetical protein
MNQYLVGELLSPAEFGVGDKVRIASRRSANEHPAPTFLQRMSGEVLEVMEPSLMQSRQTGFGIVVPGGGRPSYQVAIPMALLLPGYIGSPRDKLHVEVPELWLERE